MAVWEVGEGADVNEFLKWGHRDGQMERVDKKSIREPVGLTPTGER